MRHLLHPVRTALSVAVGSLCLAMVAAPVAAQAVQLTPEQKEQASKVVDKDLKRMKSTGEETRRLNAMIQNANPEQKHEYGKLIKQRDNQTAGTPWEAPHAITPIESAANPSTPSWHAPGNAEIPYNAPGRSHRVTEGLHEARSACAASAHPEQDSTCQALSTNSGY